MDLVPHHTYTFEWNTAQPRWTVFLVPYDLVLIIPPRIRIEIGRFSLALLGRCRAMCNLKSELVLRAGSWCEIGDSSLILLGGEHRNGSLFNPTMPGQGRIFRMFMTPEAAELSDLEIGAPTLIGDNVLISAQSVVRSGAKIGTGSIIGAGAVVARDCEPYTIYAGVPACPLRPRFSPDLIKLHQAARLGDVMAHHIPDLPVLLDLLQKGEITLDQYRDRVSFLPVRPTVHMRAKTGEGGTIEADGITGYSLGPDPITNPDALSKLNAYFSQMYATDPKVQWTADIFSALGLY